MGDILETADKYYWLLIMCNCWIIMAPNSMKGGKDMLGRNSMVIAPDKSKEFKRFLTTHGKGKAFWAKNKRIAKTRFDKDKLLALFADDKK